LRLATSSGFSSSKNPHTRPAQAGLHAQIGKYVHSLVPQFLMPLALFGIDGGGLGLVVNLLVLFLIVVYLALIYWTYLDARRRIEDPVLIACATAASVFPYLGTVVYTILRPPEFLEDREERELELRAAELELRQRIEQSCPHCEYPIERNYLRCPNCERRLRNPCRKCHKPLDPRWGICPYCETEVRKERPAAREGRRTDRQRAARAAQRQAAGRGDGPTRRQQRPAVGARPPQRPSSSR
jgi:Double zinc ribbon